MLFIMLAPIGFIHLFNLSYRKDIGYDNDILHISEFWISQNGRVDKHLIIKSVKNEI
jgi:hypothetical protein